MKLKEVLLKLMYNNNNKEICFSLDENFIKPIFISFKCKINNSFTCMLDTGAAIPVWCSGVKQLNKTFPSAVYEAELKTILSGFGTGFQVAGVYYIPEIEFNNGDGSSIRFTKFYLPVVERRTFGKEVCKSQGTSIHTKFIGSGNEFYKILVQNGSENCTEVFSKEMEAF